MSDFSHCSESDTFPSIGTLQWGTHDWRAFVMCVCVFVHWRRLRIVTAACTCIRAFGWMMDDRICDMNIHCTTIFRVWVYKRFEVKRTPANDCVSFDWLTSSTPKRHISVAHSIDAISFAKHNLLQPVPAKCPHTHKWMCNTFDSCSIWEPFVAIFSIICGGCGNSICLATLSTWQFYHLFFSKSVCAWDRLMRWCVSPSLLHRIDTWNGMVIANHLLTHRRIMHCY